MRDKYLKETWKPYPAAPVPCFSVAQFYKESVASLGKIFASQTLSIAGQIQFTSHGQLAKGVFELTGQGHRVQFNLREDVVIDNYPMEVWAKILIPGDTLACSIQTPLDPSETAGTPIVRRITALKLLAPINPSGKSTHSSPPPAASFTPQRAQLWQDFVRSVREFFVQEGFVEVATPSLVTCAGFDPNVACFQTEWETEVNKISLSLPTSPEIHLKKLLCAGWTEIFEIQKSYRNEFSSPTHEPEFWMLEWYRAYASLNDIQNDILNLLQKLNREGFIKGRLGQPQTSSIRRLFEQAELIELTPETTKQDFKEFFDKHHIHYLPDEDFTDLFHRLFIAKIEPHMPTQDPLFVCDYPPSEAALAKINSDGWADRFEFYWRDLEIANAYNELNDPNENERRYEKQVAEQVSRGCTAPKKDESFFSALRLSMPPAGGVALGLERLFMACQNISAIQDVRAFSRHNNS